VTSPHNWTGERPRTGRDFSALQTVAPAALATPLRRQPCSPAKVQLVWQMVAGPQLARAAEPEFEAPRTVRLRARDPRWARELERSRAVLQARMGPLLGLDRLELEILNPKP
jgi:hypothetical protein